MGLSSKRESYTKLAIILGTLIAFGPLSIDMYLSGLPTIAREFHTEISAVQQTLSVFFIGLALGQVIYGPLSDQLGRRRPLLFGCTLYSLACIGCALAFSIESLVVFRFIQALGGCAGVVIARSIVRDLFNQRESAQMYSLLMLVMGLAPITAPLLGGQILVIFGWRAIFLTLCGFGILCLFLVLFGLPETMPAEQRTPAALKEVGKVYGKLLGDRQFMGYALSSGLTAGAMFAYIAGSPFVFIELYNVPPERYGLLFGLNAIGLIGASQLNRWLLTYYYDTQILTSSLAFTAVTGLLLTTITATNLGGFLGFLVLLFFCIASIGMVQPNAMAAAMAPYGRHAGSAAALFGAVRFLISAGAGALVSALHNNTALPMVGTIAICSVAAFLLLQLLVFRILSTR